MFSMRIIEICTRIKCYYFHLFYQYAEFIWFLTFIIKILTIFTPLYISMQLIMRCVTILITKTKPIIDFFPIMILPQLQPVYLKHKFCNFSLSLQKWRSGGLPVQSDILTDRQFIKYYQQKLLSKDQWWKLES